MNDVSNLHRPLVAIARTPAAFAFTFANGIAVATDAPQPAALRHAARKSVAAARRYADRALTEAILRARGAAYAS